MKYSKKIEKAIKTASSAHDGQYRRAHPAPKLPYISHLFSVASIISEHTDEEDVIVAGLLHDILEDTDYSEKDLLNEFGERVHILVDSVTEATKSEKANMTWREEKENYLNKLMDGPKEACIIASADKIHNLLSVIETRITVTRNPHDYAWYHKAVFEIVSNKLGDHPIVRLHKETMKEASRIHNSRSVSSQ